METPNVGQGSRGKKVKSTSYPDPFIVEARKDHKQTLILLHGRGSNGERFGSELLKSHTSHSGKQTGPMTLADHFPNMKFIFPTARKRRAKWYKRASIHQWFDSVPINEQDSHGMSKEEECWQLEGLRESRAHVMAIIDAEVNIVGAPNVFIGGLSQGCAMSLHVLLSYEGAEPLGGFVGMSGWLPYVSAIDNILHPENGVGHGTDDDSDPFAPENDSIDDTSPPSQQNNDSRPSKAAQVCNFIRDNMDLPHIVTSDPACLQTPVLLGHGRSDERVLVGKGIRAAQCLRDLGMDVIWKDYDEGHWYKVPEQIDDIVAFLEARIAA